MPFCLTGTDGQTLKYSFVCNSYGLQKLARPEIFVMAGKKVTNWIPPVNGSTLY